MSVKSYKAMQVGRDLELFPNCPVMSSPTVTEVNGCSDLP